MYQKLFTLQEEIMKIMANQKRLEIIQLLNHKELSVSKMVEMLGIRQANLSQHLAVLRQRNLVKVRKDGQRVYYSLSNKNIAKAVDLIYRFLEEQEQFRLSDRLSANSNVYPIVRDPVCGMRISAHEAFAHTKYDDTTYFFCASGCKNKFAASPKKYVKQVKELQIS